MIFLWVARMIMAGYEWKGQRPFEKVYFTGMVRDKLRRKMSKSLGNSPDALQLIEHRSRWCALFRCYHLHRPEEIWHLMKNFGDQGRSFCNKKGIATACRFGGLKTRIQYFP
ncbi:MAG: class I tRNA ligase family protein [Saprospiraceae bacterium]